MPTLRTAAELSCLGGEAVGVTLTNTGAVYPFGSLAKIELHKITAYDPDTGAYTTAYHATCYSGKPGSGALGNGDTSGATPDNNRACYEVRIGPEDPNDEGRMTRAQAYLPRVAPGCYAVKVWTMRYGTGDTEWLDNDGGGFLDVHVCALPPLRHQEIYDLRNCFPPPWSPGVRRAENEVMVEV